MAKVIDVLWGVYVQGPDSDQPEKIQSFGRRGGEFSLCFEHHRKRLTARPGWRVVPVREEWEGATLIRLANVDTGESYSVPPARPEPVTGARVRLGEYLSGSTQRAWRSVKLGDSVSVYIFDAAESDGAMAIGNGKDLDEAITAALDARLTLVTARGLLASPSEAVPRMAPQPTLVVDAPSLSDLQRIAISAEAALILEQEGWLIGCAASGDVSSSRMRRFAERYERWQDKVKALRAEFPGHWPEPPDNS